MPIKNKDAWEHHVKINTDPYGKAGVDAARRVMELLDEMPEDQTNYDPDELIRRADNDLDIGLSGFLAGCAAQIVVQCHSRGDEFLALWNRRLWGEKGDEATQSGYAINPAILILK